MSTRTVLRDALKRDGIIVAPGAYDGISARLVAAAGFPAVYMTGAGVSASLGFPDYGLLTMTEMAERAGVMARSIGIPLIADADTGYGNELNVTRTVREYELRGVAGLHIEDQVAPKRCGHLDGKEIVPREEFLAKIRAAVQARRDPELLIIARTDARAVVDLDEAIERANAALAEGADVAFVEAPQTMEEMRSVPRRVKGPCLLNVVPGGRTPEVTMTLAREMGFKLVILPGLLLGASVVGGDRALQMLKETDAPPNLGGSSLHEAFVRFGASEWDRLLTRKN